jgi:hypothetical protein
MPIDYLVLRQLIIPRFLEQGPLLFEDQQLLDLIPMQTRGPIVLTDPDRRAIFEIFFNFGKFRWKDAELEDSKYFITTDGIAHTAVWNEHGSKALLQMLQTLKLLVKII